MENQRAKQEVNYVHKFDFRVLLAQGRPRDRRIQSLSVKHELKEVALSARWTEEGEGVYYRWRWNIVTHNDTT